ncbi:PKD domain-containing protein [Hymenobacter wooponensis]|uniref:PKD/Chitinase domain-containing protein n=1 Tax=Hymenobacter wooponensis TaxID=1525360 RepID=A0A4Z0MLX8_9BACT|nr:Ig-like domain-containing protein [Hymenobacter wooponensis]TGD80298.1 hypothetical protein EU557_10665 [Hymenobacter wooponensis]
MATTTAQLQQELDTLSRDILGTLQPGANVSGPQLAALLTRHTTLTKDLSAMQAAGASVLRYGTGVPSNSLGTDGDLYRNTANGDEYQKVAGSYVLRQNLKGKDGYTPQKGKDYVDGTDGFDGNEIVDKTYAPKAADNAGYKEGDQWFYTISQSSYERYAHLNGEWRLVFRKAETTTTPPVSADTQAPNLSFTAPASGATVPVGTQLTLTATATDNVAVTTVEFLNGATGASLGQGAKNGNTYTLPYTVSVAGPLSLVAKASDAAGNVQTGTVNITVQAPGGNVLPVANAGSDVTLQLPTNQVALMGSGTDSDGTISAYAWSQITGPNNATGIPATTQNVVVSGLVAGIYQFRLTVTDDKNGQKSDDVLVTVNAAPVSTSLPVRLLTFDDNHNPHLLAGPNRRSFTKEIGLNVVLTGTKKIHDTYGFMYGGEQYYMSSDYPGNPYEVTTITLYKANNAGTDYVTLNPVASIDFSVPGRIPSGIGGYSGIGPRPVISSPTVFLRPGGKLGIIVMYQPNTYDGSNSYGIFVEASGINLAQVSNGILLTGSALTYDQGNKATNTPGSFIDFALRRIGGMYYLAYRCFEKFNTAEYGMGLRLARSPNVLGPYNDIAANLLATAYNSEGATDITVTAEAPDLYENADGTIDFHFDDYAGLGMQYGTFPAGNISRASLSTLTQITGPNNLKLRHSSSVDITGSMPVYPDDASTAQITYSAPPATGTPTFSFMTTKKSETATDAVFDYTISTPVASATPVKIPIQISKAGTTSIIIFDFPANTLSRSGSGTSERGPNGYTNTQTLLSSTASGAVGPYNLAANSSSSFNVTGTQAASTAPPIVTLFLGDKTLEGDRVNFPALFSVDRILAQDLTVYTDVTKGADAPLRVSNIIKAGSSSAAFYGYSERRDATYLNTQALVANAAYSIGSPSGGSFQVLGLQTTGGGGYEEGTPTKILDSNSSFALAGSMQIAPAPNTDDGTMLYVEAGKDGTATIQLTNCVGVDVGFQTYDGIPVRFDVQIAGSTYNINVASPPASASSVRLPTTGERIQFPRGNYTLTLIGRAAYNSALYADFILAYY